MTTTTTRPVNPFGTHRALRPLGTLPYTAEQIDVSLPVRPTEIQIEVEKLNIDSASFVQLAEETGRDFEAFKARVLGIVAERGKMHNPVTGSGGVLIGRVSAIGEGRTDDLKVGDRIVTLISLTTTPLFLEDLHEVDWTCHQVRVTGRAFLFEKSLYAKLPGDLPEKLALSVLDVCGAPAQARRLVKPGMKVVVIGAAGKSGLMCSWIAAEQVGETGQVIGVVPFAEQAAFLRTMPKTIDVLELDARDAVKMYEEIGRLTDGQYADLVINCVNVAHTEMPSILATRNRGTVYFFSMATNFQSASLGAESVGQDIDLLMGNGYAAGHAEIALDTVRHNPALRAMIEQLSK